MTAPPAAFAPTCAISSLHRAGAAFCARRTCHRMANVLDPVKSLITRVCLYSLDSWCYVLSTCVSMRRVVSGVWSVWERRGERKVSRISMIKVLFSVERKQGEEREGQNNKEKRKRQWDPIPRTPASLTVVGIPRLSANLYGNWSCIHAQR